MSQAIPTILCVNDDPDILKLITVILKYEGYHIVTTQSETAV
jgi:CheY-like chemotaxis protein